MRKIEVKTKCGETFTLEVDTDQEIASMEEIVEKNYDIHDKYKAAFKALNNKCPGARCSRCAFGTKAGNCTHVTARDALKKARAYDGE